ncbi:MAG: cobalt ECF transporter T component CbiQ [Proteobacteria bacterium]|nr:cobalt ECF transporter T component CbiQ [Pseudomonadota bacterium]
MINEPFASGNSIVHRLDPRFRTFFAVLLSIEVALLKDFSAMGFALLVAFFLAASARLNIREVMKRLSSIFGFLLLLWIVIPLTYEGTPAWQAGWLTWTREGIHLSAQISLKSTAILMIFMALVATMTLSTLGRALKRLSMPGKLVHLLLMTYRYIFVIGQEYQRLYTAMRIRGFRPSTSLHSYKTYAYLFGMLFVRASKRAERVNQAMILRGFNGRFYSLDDFQPSYKNWIFAGTMMMIFTGILLMENGLLWPMKPF